MPIGFPPTASFQLIDGDFINGLIGGHNWLFKNGLTAVGNNQASSLQLPDRVAILQIDTSSSSTGVALPAALAGVDIKVNNNTGNNITVYPSIANNPVTNAQDTFNNAATSFTLNAHTSSEFTCGLNGTWFTN